MGSIAPSKKCRSKTSFDDLPLETAIDTFLRLPVKTLIRSTWVSKTWNSLIANPNFVSAQIRRSISCCDKTAVLIVPTDISISDKTYCSLTSVETGHVIDKYEIPFNTRSGTLKLVGSINGLLYLTDLESQYAYQDLYLWNPSVRKYKCVVSSCLRGRAVAGFGFHEPTHDYRVVRIEYPAKKKRNKRGKLAPKVEIFSLQVNKWRSIETPTVPRVVLGSGTTINSSAYWINNLHTRTYHEEVWILSFDFNNEVFGQLKLSDDVRYCLGEAALFKLMQFEGSLSVCVYKVGDSIGGDSNGLSQPCCIWLMRQEDGIISWTIRFKVVLNELGCPYKITRSGTLIMMSLFYGSPNRSIMSCDLNSMQYKYLEFDNPLVKNVTTPATIDTCFIESLVMHVGGDELLKSAP